MGHLFVVVGKSATGKDTIVGRLLDRLGVESLVPYTTRPMRPGEVDGVTYNFVDEEFLNKEFEKDNILECRSYTTVHGVWSYFELVSQLDPNKDYILVVSYDGWLNIKKKLEGNADVEAVPLYIWVDSYNRILRSLNRTRDSGACDYSEVCARYLREEALYTDEEAMKGIQHCFCNEDLDETVSDIENLLVQEYGVNKQKELEVDWEAPCPDEETIERIREMFSEDNVEETLANWVNILAQEIDKQAQKELKGETNPC